MFRGRFKSQLVKHERYLLYLLAYIHLNPLRVRLITRLDGLDGWTSHRAYMEKDPAPEWLTTKVLGSQFDSPAQMKEWILRLHQKAEPWPEGMGLKDGWFQWHLCPVDMREEVIPEDEKGISEQSFIDAICQVTGASSTRLREHVRGPLGNPERRFAVWAFRTSTYCTYKEIGSCLDMTVEHVARDVRRLRGNIPRLSDWMDEWLERFPSKVTIV